MVVSRGRSHSLALGLSTWPFQHRPLQHSTPLASNWFRDSVWLLARELSPRTFPNHWEDVKYSCWCARHPPWWTIHPRIKPVQRKPCLGWRDGGPGKHRAHGFERARSKTYSETFEWHRPTHSLSQRSHSEVGFSTRRELVWIRIRADGLERGSR